MFDDAMPAYSNQEAFLANESNKQLFVDRLIIEFQNVGYRVVQKRIPLEVGLLRFFYAYIQRVDGSLLAECWPLLLSLLKEGLQISLTPPALFLLLS